MSPKEINDFFKHIVAKDNNAQATEIREMTRVLCLKINELVPPGPDKEQVIVKLKDMALMSVYLINCELAQEEDLWREVPIMVTGESEA